MWSATEHARLEDQSAGLAELMHNNVIHTPLSSPSRLVDVGCGTGIISRDLGNRYPSAQIYGVDLSQVPLAITPSNVEYIVGDVRQLLKHDERFAHGSADFVFSRLLVLGMTNWPDYVRDMASLVRAGGWVEIQDISLHVYLNGSRCSDDWEWWEAICRAAQQKKWDLDCGRNVKYYMQQAGLVDISVKEYKIPFGTWQARQRPETKRIGGHAAREYGVTYYHAIPKMLQGMGYSEEKIEGFRKACIEDLGSQEGKYFRFFVTLGRRP